MPDVLERLRALGYPGETPQQVPEDPELDAQRVKTLDRLVRLGWRPNPGPDTPTEEMASGEDAYQQALQSELDRRSKGLMPYLPGPIKDVASAAAGYASDMAGIGLRGSAAVENAARLVPDSAKEAAGFFLRSTLPPGLGPIGTLIPSMSTPESSRKKLDLANQLQQASEALDQAVETARGKGTIAWARKMGTGALRSGANMVTGGLLGGPTGAYLLAGATEASQKYGELERKGSSEAEQLGWATAAGVWEASVGGILQKMGLGGAETLLKNAGKGAIKQLWKMPLKQAAKEVLKIQGQEILDEGFTEEGHLAMSYADGTRKYVSPEETLMEILRTARDTAAQTFIMTGGVQAGTQVAARNDTPSGVPLPKVTSPGSSPFAPPTLEELRGMRAKGYASRKDGQSLGLTPEEMTDQKRRTEALDRRIQELQAQETPDAGTIPGPQKEIREEQGGEDLRRTGKKQVPKKPESEVTPAREAEVPVGWRGDAPVVDNVWKRNTRRYLQEGVEPSGLSETKQVPLDSVVSPEHDYASPAVLAAMENDPNALPPIIVEETQDGKFEIADGGSRYAAARKLGMATVPVRVVSYAESVAAAVPTPAVAPAVTPTTPPVAAPPAAKPSKAVEYTPESATEAWVQSYEDPDFIRRRPTLIDHTRRLAKRLTGWKTSDELTVKDRSGRRDAGRTSRTLKELQATGHVQVAWDREGNAYHAWGNEKLPAWLTQSKDEDAMAALPERTATEAPPATAVTKSNTVAPAAKITSDQITQTASKVKPALGNRKFFISDLYDALPEDQRGSLADFKQRLLEMHRAGEITLQRADLTLEEPGWIERRDNSALKVGAKELNYVVLSEAPKAAVTTPQPSAKPAAPWRATAAEIASRAVDTSTEVTLPDMLQTLQKQYPDLTVEEFQKGMLELQDQGAVQLREYTWKPADVVGKPGTIQVPPDNLRPYGELLYYARAGQKPSAPAEVPDTEAPAATVKIEPDPVAELAKAGVTVKRTKTGWTVSGLTQETGDGLRGEYQGQRRGNGKYSFKRDPTEALPEAVKSAAEKAERDATARAGGMVVTSIGYLTPEKAAWYEEQRAQRLAAAREPYEALDNLLAQAVSKSRRGKLALDIRRAEDADKVKGFDYLVDYSKEHPELGMPQDETGLFEYLKGKSIVFDEKAALEDIDNDLFDELQQLTDDGDIEFPFGSNVEGEVAGETPATTKQTAIPGFEEDAERVERAEQVKRAKEKVKEEIEGKKGTQKNLFGKSGALGSRNLFADTGVPDDMVQRQAEESGDEDFGKPDSAVPLLAMGMIPGVLPGAQTQPQRGGMLRSVKHFFQRFFAVRGELPQDVYDAKVRKEGRVAKQMQLLRQRAADFKRSVRKSLGMAKTLRQVDVERMNAVLRGDQSLATVPQNIRTALQSMRDHIDALSRRLISAGVAQGDLIGIIAENMGVYVTRSYRVFDDPKWRDKVPVEFRNRAVAAIREMYPDKSDADIQGIFKSLLYRGDAKTPVALLKGSKLGSKDLSIFMKRKDIPEWLRDLWGEYKDAGVNYARSIFKMSHLLANHEFLNEVRGSGEGVWLRTPEEGPTVNEYGELVVPIAAPASSVMAPLNGCYTTPEIKAAFETLDSPGAMPDWLRGLMTVNYAVKYGKTVLSVQTQIRNFISNIGFAVGNGHYRVQYAGKAFRATLTGMLNWPSPEYRAYYARLAELGVVGEDVRAGELKDAIRDASKADIDEFLYTISDITQVRNVRGAVRGFFRGASALYQAGDAVWKVYAFENEKARLRKSYPDWNEGQIEERAAAIVRDTYPTYSKIPAGIKAIRRFPLVGPFVSFSSEVVRTHFNTMQIGMQEMKDPATLATGAQRIAGTVAAFGGLTVLARAMMAHFGIGDDEDEDLRWFVPPYQENSRFIYTSKPQDANYRFVDLGYSDPHAYLVDPAIAFSRGEDWKDAFGKSLAEFLRPFASEEILAGALMDLRSNEGDKIYNPHDMVGEQAKDMAWHMWSKALEPGTITSLRRINTAISGTDPRRDVTTEVTAMFSGQRRQKVDVEHSLGFRVRDFAKALTEIQGIARRTATSRGKATGEMVATDLARMEKLRLASFAEMQKIIGAARRLGVPEDNIRTLLMDSLSDEIAKDIQENDYTPYEMTPETVKQMYQARPEEFQERFSGWHEGNVPEAIKKHATPLVTSIPYKPVSTDKKTPEEYRQEVQKQKATMETNKKILDALGVSHDQAQRLLLDYHRRPDRADGNERIKGKSDLEAGYKARGKAIAKLYGKTDEDWVAWYYANRDLD